MIRGARVLAALLLACAPAEAQDALSPLPSGGLHPGAVLQDFNGRQGVENRTRGGALAESAQNGVNILNLLQADRVDGLVGQAFPATAGQDVLNLAAARGPVDGLAQSGVNIANLVSASHVEGIARTAGGRQEVVNILRARGPVAGLEQSGTNVVNYAEVATFGRIEQTADGHQMVRNEVHARPGVAVSGLSQSGLNVANLVRLTSLATADHTIVQSGTADQTVRNIAPLGAAGAQSSVNASNMVIVDVD